MNMGKSRVLLSVLSLLLLVASYGHADTDSKTAKIKELQEITGIYDMIKQAQLSTQEMLKSRASVILQQVQANLPNSKLPSDPRTATALEKYFNQAGEPVPTTEEAVKMWGQLYGSSLTEEDFDGILAYYRSAIGQKDIHATKNAAQEFNKFILGQATQHINKTSAELLNELSEIARSLGKSNQ